MDGKGNGPASAALACKSLPDLTTSAKRNNQKSAEEQVGSVLEFGTPSKAHGATETLIWGPLFRSLSDGGPVAKLRIKNLCDYVNLLQEK